MFVEHTQDLLQLGRPRLVDQHQERLLILENSLRVESSAERRDPLEDKMTTINLELRALKHENHKNGATVR